MESISNKFEKKFKLLKELEGKANKYAYNAYDGKDYEDKMSNYNSRINSTRRKWEALITELRGWVDGIERYTYDENDKLVDITKPEWIEHCKIHNLNPSYNFGDVLA